MNQPKSKKKRFTGNFVFRKNDKKVKKNKVKVVAVPIMTKNDDIPS